MSEQERKSFSLYLEPEKRQEIEDYFLTVCKIKNFNDGYRNLINLGFQELKKLNKRN